MEPLCGGPGGPWATAPLTYEDALSKMHALQDKYTYELSKNYEKLQAKIEPDNRNPDTIEQARRKFEEVRERLEVMLERLWAELSRLQTIANDSGADAVLAQAVGTLSLDDQQPFQWDMEEWWSRFFMATQFERGVRGALQSLRLKLGMGGTSWVDPWD